MGGSFARFVATTASIRAQGATSTTLLATQKLEQLRGLTWGFGDESELWRPLTDETTNRIGTLAHFGVAVESQLSTVRQHQIDPRAGPYP